MASENLMLSNGGALQRVSSQRAIDAEIPSIHRGGSLPYGDSLFCDTLSLPNIARGLRRRAPRISNTLKMSERPLRSFAKREGLTT
ncbi:hypothetical protein [Bradyrhizobium cytisi]|uniref:Uncharacterized protein n=1 Tax=Bradyrhizobium cytisi TaxID=515489 RepID=A0A5S4VWS8_9BRAD|nr:hypothetical protein [Bradyrhizobium cytisi]TYL71764.1 hypothetical protein FXB38_39730 [Bradyrhizobium cytisi]